MANSLGSMFALRVSFLLRTANPHIHPFGSARRVTSVAETASGMHLAKSLKVDEAQVCSKGEDWGGKPAGLAPYLSCEATVASA